MCVMSEICAANAGKIVQSEWEGLPNRFPGLELDEFVVMPNHIHGILVITENLEYSQPAKRPRPTLGDIISDYKGAATYHIRHPSGLAEFEWQKGFYDEIIRDTAMLDHIRHYIATNPEQWLTDKLHPSNDTR
jgi:putative transposase